MVYINRDLADEEDIEDINEKIDAILEILHMKGIIPESDHWNVVEIRNNLRVEMMEDE